MCNEREGRILVLHEPSVKGSPKPSGTPLHVQVVTRRAASMETRRSSVQYTSSAAARHGSGGLFPAENTCRRWHRMIFRVAFASRCIVSLSNNTTNIWTQQNLGEALIPSGQDQKQPGSTPNRADQQPHREFPTPDQHATHPQAIHGRRRTENRQYTFL